MCEAKLSKGARRLRGGKVTLDEKKTQVQTT